MPKADERSALVSSDTPRLPLDIASVHIFRLIGILHIVWDHFDQQVRAGGRRAWGPTWVTFFFMISGFGAAHAKLCADSSMAASSSWLPNGRTLRRRLAGVYPSYVASLLLGAASMWASDRQAAFSEADAPLVLVLQTLLLTSFVPSRLVLFAHSNVNTAAWFVSALAFMWLLEQPVFEAAKLAQRHRVLWLLPTAIIAYIVACPAALFPLTWGRGYIFWGPPPWPSQWWFEIPALTFCHQYVAGVAAAVWAHDRANRGASPIPYAAEGALFVLVVVFAVVPMPSNQILDWGYHTGVLLPVHILLVLGLAEGGGPLSTLCARWPLPLVRPFSLGAYLLQRPIGDLGLFAHTLGADALPFAVMAAATLGAIPLHYLVQVPLGKLMLGQCLESGRDAEQAKGSQAPPASVSLSTSESQA